jgi:hypothetical protein
MDFNGTAIWWGADWRNPSVENMDVYKAALPTTWSTDLTAATVFNPTSLSFANQTVNTTSPASSVVLTNKQLPSMTITTISLTGANAGDYSLTPAHNCPISPSTIAPNATCTINVQFRPTATGVRSASISFIDDATGSPQTIPLSGTGI